MGRGGAPAREISFVSLVVYGPKVSDSALAMGFTASETRQGGSQQSRCCQSCWLAPGSVQRSWEDKAGTLGP